MTVVERTGGWRAVNLRELWRYRELLYFLAWRDVKVRYKQTALGAAWAVLQPLATMALFAVVFRRFAHVPSDGIPYPLFAFAALLPWQFFASAANHAGMSLVDNRNLVTKVYFPRILLPAAATLPGLLDLAVGLGVLAVLMAVYGQAPSARVVFLPLFLLLALAAAAAVGLWWAAWNVRYRDVKYTMPLLTQLWLLATPVAYPVSVVPERWRVFYELNPMAGVVEGFRWTLVGGPSPGRSVALSAAVVAIVLAAGLAYFARTERNAADVV